MVEDLGNLGKSFEERNRLFSGELNEFLEVLTKKYKVTFQAQIGMIDLTEAVKEEPKEVENKDDKDNTKEGGK